MINFDKTFDSIMSPGAYTLIDHTHPLEFYIGLDDYGRKSLILRSKYKPEKVKRTSAIEISIGTVKNNIWSLGFHLSEPTMTGLFYKFIDDIVESSRNLPSSVLDMGFVIQRYNNWKKLFYKLKKDILSENEIMGLIGELLFLKDNLLLTYDEDDAINSWSGCSKTHKDFSIQDIWYEIKTTTSSSLSIKINSIQQLDSDIDGELVVYELEKMSESYNGYTLNSIIRDLLNKVSAENEDVILEKLKEVGWSFNDQYDKFVYRVVNYNRYLVNNIFPRIRKCDISDSIVRVEYEILKKDLIMYKVSDL